MQRRFNDIPLRVSEGIPLFIYITNLLIVEDAMESLKTQMLSVTSTDSSKQKQGKNDEVVNRLEQQLAELKATMSNRLDTELRAITESISMLKTNSSRHASSSPKVKKSGAK